MDRLLLLRRCHRRDARENLARWGALCAALGLLIGTMALAGCADDTTGLSYEIIAAEPEPRSETPTDPANLEQPPAATGVGDEPTTPGPEDPVDEPTEEPVDTDPGTEPYNPVDEPPVDPGCEPGSGCFGEPCDSPDECLSGVCVEHMGSTVCSKVCDSPCPQGWSCKQEIFSGADVASVCLSDHANLCRPCVTSTDCHGSPTSLESCVIYGSWKEDASYAGFLGRFCASDCEVDTDCPTGFSCLESLTSEGTTLSSCVKAGGDCECSEVAVALELQTPCEWVNDEGVCTGVRSCLPSGLTSCDAEVPAAEICNGIDDDCNGVVDDDIQAIVCGVGACAHEVTGCEDGVPVGCDPLLGAEEEVCDGIDNNCDGIIDDGLGTQSCGVGACAHSVALCAAGAHLECDPFEGASLEACDGIDNDCDGEVDEGNADGCSFYYEDGDKDGFGAGVPACLCAPANLFTEDTASDCNDDNAIVKPGALETCDGIDEDCNGLADDGLGTTSCGLGVCEHTINNCQDAALQTCDPFEGLSTEICDGLDNDCDGEADEALEVLTCGLGVCAHSEPSCIGGAPQLCDPFEGLSGEICDGLDNDCDGLEDEELGTTSCGVGVCAHTAANCAGGALQTCDPLEGAGGEICDGLDNDCDGVNDEELGSTTCGLSHCAHTVENCVGGSPQICDPFAGATTEVCDGVDNDCDGSADEGLGKTSCGVGVCAHSVKNCLNGSLQSCNPTEGASNESCDGKDNDCDGSTDEGLGNTSCGVGQCAHTQKNCVGGSPKSCDPLQGAQSESCDNQDNDCDGAVDEGFACGFPGGGGGGDGCH